MTLKRFLPSEWHPQDMVQLTWPHSSTDWAYIMDEVTLCYVTLASEIAKREKLLIVAANPDEVRSLLGNDVLQNTTIIEAKINDTWARDHGFITMYEEGRPLLLDFKFNGWGLKFASNYDNLINRTLFNSGIFSDDAKYENHLNMVLEGGSIESDGNGTILTTSECLLSPNRNGEWDKTRIDSELKNIFGASKVLWLDHGYLSGDDTDSHIDTLARLAPDNRILYVKCDDVNDEHYQALKEMEKQLETFTSADNQPYKLVALPMCSPVYNDGERLPGTYANFLFVNDAILVPTYGQETDVAALEVFYREFPDMEVVGINCLPLIKQHGSLHCVTMQFPVNVLKK